MATAMMMERSTSGFPTFATSPATPTMPSGMPGAANWCMVPRCEIKFEKCAGGMKIHCKCDDEVACGALQNLCKMLAGSMCNCCCTYNGMPMCQVNLCCGNCTCEYTADGVCITCTSGDKACCDMLQSYCDCLCCCGECGCMCYVCFGNTPVCCGTCC